LYRIDEILAEVGAAQLLNYRGINHAAAEICDVKFDKGELLYQLSVPKKTAWLRRKLTELGKEVQTAIPQLAGKSSVNPYQHIAIAIVLLKHLVSLTNYNLLICLSKCTKAEVDGVERLMKQAGLIN
jgi:hypothetical protein